MKLCLTFFTVAFLLVVGIKSQQQTTVIPSFVLQLHSSIIYLPEATSQPISGLWSPVDNKIIFSVNEQPAVVKVFDCGYVMGVTFPTRSSNYIYSCETSDDGMKTWLGSSLLVLGSGEPVTLYDNINTKRFYRVKESNYASP